MQFDAAITIVIVVIISPKCQPANSKVLIGTCHILLKLYAAVRTLFEGLRATNDNKEGLLDTYALFRDELYAIIKEIREKIYWPV